MRKNHHMIFKSA